MNLDLLSRGAVQALASYGLASTAMALVVAWAWPRVARLEAPPPRLARRLFLLRLAPAMAGGALAAPVILAFALWEPRVETEPVGAVAVSLAALGATVLIAGAWRAARAVARTWRTEQQLGAAARACLLHQPVPGLLIEAAFPVVAVLGLVRARLVVARVVAECCTAEEFRAIIAHELAHAGARDNLRRLALVAAPDVLAWSRRDAARRDDWSGAAELAADARAAADGRHLYLASALIKVARLAAAPGAPLPASALYRGESVADRVRRLLDPPAPVHPARAGRLARLALALAALSAPLWLRAMHAAAESLLALP